jgi:mRNA interferase RelE/StbE
MKKWGNVSDSNEEVPMKKGETSRAQMKYSVVYETKAERVLRKLDRAVASMIYAWIEKNLVGTTDPRRYGQALSANPKGLWRYRVGDYRLIAEIVDNEVKIIVVQVGHRSRVYGDT